MESQQMVPLCDRCGEPVNVRYFLMERPWLAHLRGKWNFPNYLSELLGEDISVFNLLSFLIESYFYF